MSQVSDIVSGELRDRIPLADVPEILPRRRAGRKISTSTVYRWSTLGCRGKTLQTEQVGGMRYTTRQWLNDFFSALTNARNPGRPEPARSVKARYDGAVVKAESLGF